MPIYEYECPKCGVFELSQRITEPSLRRCPTCKAKVSKLISSTSFTLKGSGWYATDYANKGKSPESKSSEGSTSADGGSAGASSESGSSDSKSSSSDAKNSSNESKSFSNESKSSSNHSKPSTTSKSEASAA